MLCRFCSDFLRASVKAVTELPTVPYEERQVHNGHQHLGVNVRVHIQVAAGGRWYGLRQVARAIAQAGSQEHPLQRRQLRERVVGPADPGTTGARLLRRMSGCCAFPVRFWKPGGEGAFQAGDRIEGSPRGGREEAEGARRRAGSANLVRAAWRARRSHSPGVQLPSGSALSGFLRIFDPTVPRVPGRQNRFSRRAPGRLGLGLREASLWGPEGSTPGCPARSLLAHALRAPRSAHLPQRQRPPELCASTESAATGAPSRGGRWRRGRLAPACPRPRRQGLADHPRTLQDHLDWKERPGNWDPRGGGGQEYWLFPGTLLRQLAPLPGVSPASYAPFPQGNCPGSLPACPSSRLPAEVGGRPFFWDARSWAPRAL